MSVKNKVQLITYPDSLGGNLKSLHKVLEKNFKDIFQGGIHILPPFPSSGDRGFAPLTYLEIDPKFGTWEDIKKLSEDYDLLLDLMVNHISAKSEYFKDFLKYGRKSKYFDLFLTIDKIFPDGQPEREIIEKIFLRREEPYSDFTIEETGEKERVWTTFGKVTPSEQIDLDINSKATKDLLTKFFTNFNKNNIKIVRLDAVGYLVKKPGTSCFMIEPEIYEILDWLSAIAKSLNIELLPEVHSHYSIQYKLAEKGFWIYDFILPYMVLETLITKKSNRLKKYLKERPHKQFTMLDCHDGIPIKPDLDDFVDTPEIKKIVDVCIDRGANLSLIFSKKHLSDDGFNVHQIRGSFYSLVDCDDDAYIAARAIQLFSPGIPQIYYVGLLAGENDVENVERTGEGREINRHNYSSLEIDDAVKKDVVKRLIELIKFRNQYPVFNGHFEIEESESNMIIMKWREEEHKCDLVIDLQKNLTTINYLNENKDWIAKNI